MIYVFDPTTMIVEYNLQMVPNTLLFSIWRQPPLKMYLKVYVFNITNPIEFLNGEENIKFEEIGPYVYQEILVHENITFNDNNTMSYIPRRTIVYIPEMSIGDPAETVINVVNIPYLGVTSALSDAGFMVNYPIAQLANFLKTKPILNITVYDYLWGFEDPLVKLASGIVPNFINFQKFGLLDRMYDDGENIVTVNLQKKDDMLEEEGRYLSIDKYNGSPGMAHWGYIDTEGNETREENTICNRLRGATEGVIYPSHMDKRAKFRIYRKAFCRPLPVTFRKETWTENGVPGYMYTLADDFADPGDQNPDNECFCRKKTCLKKGLVDLTPCYYNIPAAESFPHFLDADPSLLENIEGLKPDKEKHGSYCILQQTVGMPVEFHSRLQTNLIMRRSRYNSKLTPFNDLTLPLFWFESYMVMPNYLVILLKLGLRILPIAQAVLMYLLGVIGLTTSVLSLISIAWIFNQQQQQQKQEITRSNDNLDLRVPLCNGPYLTTSINILPPIKCRK